MPFPAAVPLAALLALQWPISTLAGLRRFFARGGGGVPPWADGLTLVVAAIATVGSWLAPFEFASPAQILVGASLIVTIYAPRSPSTGSTTSARPRRSRPS